MIFQAALAIAIAMAVLVVSLLLVRRARATLALPLAYMINLLLIHLPGAYAFVISGGEYSGMNNSGDAIAVGIAMTAVACVCFVIGVALSARSASRRDGSIGIGPAAIDRRFQIFCLACGWVLAFGLGPLLAIPTVGAAIYFGSAVWMLATLVGLVAALRLRSVAQFMIWLTVLLVYPLVVLIFSGFLGYGAAAAIIVGSLAVVQSKSVLRSLLVIVALGYLGLSVFVNYFDSRAELRSTLWSSSGFEQRVDAVVDAFRDFELFSHNNPQHLKALTMRLNQNEFVGIAVNRLDTGQADYLKGHSLYEAVIAPIPRALWPDKPVQGGSASVVREMTGLRLGTKTSWGVGNVMEFYINFGLWSLIPCFVLLGLLIGWLDRRAAELLESRDPSRALIYFLPCVALIQPNGSVVELVGGAFAAALAAFGLRMAWLLLTQNRQGSRGPVPGLDRRAMQ